MSPAASGVAAPPSVAAYAAGTYDDAAAHAGGGGGAEGDIAAKAAPMLPRSESARLNAIAKLRRAATQREVKRTSPRRFRLHLADAPQVERGAPAEGSVWHVGDEGAGVLPSLEQLRQRILQERKRSGLSRSASTSATSKVARAYTMQKLMGASTPVPYNDMFDFVRSVNASRMAELEGSSEPAAAPPPTSPVRDAPRTDASPPPDAKRATLMRSVSARDIARRHMFKKIVRRAEAPPADSQAPPAPSQAAQATRTRADAPAPDASRAQMRPGPVHTSAFSDDSSAPDSNSERSASSEVPTGRRSLAWSGAPALRTSQASLPTDETRARPDLVRHSEELRRLNEASRRLDDAVRSSAHLRAPAPPGPSTASPALGVASVPWGAPMLGAGLAPAWPDTAGCTGGLGSEAAEHAAGPSRPPADRVARAPADALGLPETLASELDAEAREARARRMRRRHEADVSAAHVHATASPASAASPREMDPRPPGAWPSPTLHSPLGAAPAVCGPAGAAVARGAPASPQRAAAATDVHTHAREPALRPSPPRPHAEKPLPQLPARPGGVHHTRSVSVGAVRTGAFGTPSAPADGALAEAGGEGRGARLFGSLRRKTSRRGLRRERHGAQASDAGVPVAGVVLQGDEVDAAPQQVHTVVLPVTPAALAQWNQTLVRPIRHVLECFPAELPLALALAPPRHLRRVLPLLEAAGDAYVKLRYLFVFDDVLVLAKPALAPRAGESLPEYMVHKLSSAPDLGEVCSPLAVLDLTCTRIEGGAPDLARLGALMRARHEALHTDLDAALRAVVSADAALSAPDARTLAALLYADPSLDRALVSRYLFARRDVLAAYVAQHRFDGASIESALRVLLLDVPWPETREAFDALLAAFAAQWHASNPARLSAALVGDVARALVALHDAVHGAPGRAAADMTLEQFLEAVRVHDARRVLSERELREAYLAVKMHAFVPAAAAAERLPITFDAGVLAAPLVPGVPSAPVRVALPAPDADLRVRLVGRDVYADPPVLTFAHAAHAEFTVCTTAPGPHELLFVRVGRTAGHYAVGAPVAGGASAQLLPRSVTLASGAALTRPSLTLVHSAPHAAAMYTFYLSDAAAAEHMAALLRGSIEAARAGAQRLSPLEIDARALARVVLEAALVDDERRRLRVRAPCTGGELARVVCENSLLPCVVAAQRI